MGNLQTDEPSNRVGRAKREKRPETQFVLDGIAWLVTIPFAAILRYDFDVSKMEWLPLLLLAVALVGAQWAAGGVFALYRGRFTYGSFEEVRGVSLSATVVAAVTTAITLAVGPFLSIPRSVVIIAFPLAVIFMLGTRYLKRLLIDRSNRPKRAAPTLIYGAGYLGDSLVRRMVTDPYSPYFPVGFLDDDPARARLQIRDIPVLGRFSDIGAIVERTGAEVLVVAIGGADMQIIRRVDVEARALGLTVKVMPLLGEMLQGHGAQLTALRNIEIQDLIARTPIDTNVEEIAGYLTGKRVLVTGAGGSIGSELARQIMKFGPRELILLDRDETGLQETQISIEGNGLLNTDNVLLADIRDPDLLNKAFLDRKPQVVFHAAALKHLPLLEQYPDEAWKTNVIGTLNVLHAAQAARVETFVNVSTDKAANPTSVLGHSKRVAEKLTAWMAIQEKERARYVSVRFGNVIGSRGSMLPVFTRLIEQGGPLTVTHPEVTRYFMTIPEACQLVMQAGGIGSGGEVLILDMGEPVKILDVAKKMIQLSGKNIEIVFTGLRNGEKLHEVLIGESERDKRPFHKLITHANVGVLSPTKLDQSEWESRLGRDDHSNVQVKSNNSIEVASERN